MSSLRRWSLVSVAVFCSTAMEMGSRALADNGPGSICTVKIDKAPLQIGKEVLGRLNKGQRLKVLKTNPPWVWTEAKVNGQPKRGWIHSRFLEFAGADTGSGGKATARPSVAGVWPQFRGPNRDGLSSETGLLKQWPGNGPPLLWTAKGCGVGYASVAVVDGLIYTAGNVGNASAVVAFDLNGQRKWTTPVGGPARGGGYPGARGTPTVDGGKVYWESPNGDVVCLDAKTGRKIWSLNILQSFNGRNIQWALSESVLIDGNNLICCPGGAQAGVVALNKDTGKTVWICKETRDQPGYASPIVFEYRGVRQIVTMTAKAAVGVEAGTGKLLWRHEHRTEHGGNIPTPIYHDGHVFISSGYRTGSVLLRLDVSGRNVSVAEVWRVKALDNHHGGVILVDGCLYGSNFGGQWLCLDFKTGREEYAEGGLGKGSVTYADGMLYCLGQGGRVGLVRATPQGHRLISQCGLPAGGSKESWAHPVVCGGRLYIRHGDALFAFDIRQK